MLGGNVFGWTADESASHAILDAYVDAGMNFVDTADVYSRWAPGHQGGESESVIGNWFAKSGKRQNVIIATKVGLDMGPAGKGLSKDHILRSAEASLKRLQTDVIDLYQSHQDDAAVPLEETLGAYAQLVREGKVRAIGASNYRGERLRAALEASLKAGLPAYVSLQPHYNLIERAEYEADLAPVVGIYGLGVVPYYSLAAGFLTGKYRSEQDLTGRARAGTVKKYLNDRGMRILRALDDVAQRYEATPTKVALAWLLAQPGITAPIASATNAAQLQELIEATSLTLDGESLRTLDAASAQAAAA